MTARFDSNCKCGRRIKRGERIFYYPRSREALCDGPDCGQKAGAEFYAAAQDEDWMCGQFSGGGYGG